MAGDTEVGITITAKDQFTPVFQKLARNVASIHKKIESAVTFAHLGKLWTEFYTESKIVETVKKVFELAEGFEEVHKRLLLVTGSAATAGKASEDIREIWENAHESLASIERAYTGFIAIGKSTEFAKKQTEKYAEVVRGSSTPLDDFARMMLNLEIMSAKPTKVGNVSFTGLVPARMLKTLLLQVPSLNFALTQLAQKAGMSKDKLDKLIASGLLPFVDVMKAVDYAAENKAPETLGEQFEITGRKFQSFIVDSYDAIVNTKKLSANVEAFNKKLSALKDSFKAFLEANPQIAKMIGLFGVLLVSLIPIVLAVQLLTLNFIWIPLLIASVAAGIIYLYNKSELFRSTIRDIGSKFSEMKDALKGLGLVLDFLYEKAKKLVLPFAEPVKKFTKGVSEAFGVGAPSWLDQAKGLGMKALDVATMGQFKALASIEHGLADIGRNGIAVTVNVNDKAGVLKSVDVQQGNKKTTLNTGQTNHSSRVVGR